MTDDRETPQTRPAPAPAPAGSDRHARVAANLRDNLLKRKALSRARAARTATDAAGGSDRPDAQND